MDEQTIRRVTRKLAQLNNDIQTLIDTPPSTAPTLVVSYRGLMARVAHLKLLIEFSPCEDDDEEQEEEDD